MPKRVKITLCIILILSIVAVVWLIIWNVKKTQTPIDIAIETLTWEEIIDNWDTIDLEPQNNTFEDDIMKDLEWFFGNNNGYEDIEWEYWFTNAELE